MNPHRILVDTGPLVALLSRRDKYHDACVDQLRHLSTPLVTCWPVVTEAAWLLKENPLAVRRLLESFNTGFMKLATVEDHAFQWIADFLNRYNELGAQLADACLMYLAETENIETVFNLDQKDFFVYRLSGNRTLHVIPE